MNEKQLKQINKGLTDSRTKIKFKNCNLQENILEQLELTTCKMFEYIRDQSDFLKRYIQNIREIKSDDVSLSLLDGLEEAITAIKQDLSSIHRAAEETKTLAKGNGIQDMDSMIFHETELCAHIISLDRIEKVLFSYPPIEN